MSRRDGDCPTATASFCERRVYRDLGIPTERLPCQEKDRLDTILPRNRLLVSPPTDYSFPSGHTLASFEAATALYKDHTVYGFLAFVLAILIAFSRIYLQVHYPSDVLGGAILGFLFGLLGSTIVRAVCDKWAEHKSKKEAQAAAEKEESSKDTSEDAPQYH